MTTHYFLLLPMPGTIVRTCGSEPTMRDWCSFRDKIVQKGTFLSILKPHRHGRKKVSYEIGFFCFIHSRNNMYTSDSLYLDITPPDIIAELVAICTTPAPPNPFAIDFDYFDSLPLQEKFLASGAMMNFLKQVLCARTHSYDRRSKSNMHSINKTNFLYGFHFFIVRVDLQKISSIHFRCLYSLYHDGHLSIPNNDEIQQTH